MPKTETAAETVLENGPTDATPKQYCADGCGARVGNPKSTFLQGHDQRLVSRLATEVVEHVALSDFARGLLTLTDYDDNDDIQDRIDQVHARVILRFSVGLGDKFNSAAHRRWELSGKRADRAAQKAVKAAAPKKTRRAKGALVEGADPALAAANEQARLNHEPVGQQESTVGQEIVNLRGTEVQVKIGRWTYTAVVHGMNQKGKVTAVEYTDGKGETKTTDKFTLVS